MSVTKFQVEYIAMARRYLNLSKSYVAKQVGLHHSNYNKLESKSVDPLFDNILKIINFFEMQGIDFHNFETKKISISSKEERLSSFRIKHIFTARNRLELTQEQVSKMVKMDKKNYMQIETGQVKPRLNTAIKILKFFEGKGIDFQKLAIFYNSINA